jgi:hypothetical protein
MGRQIAVFSARAEPASQQSGQSSIGEAYEVVRELKKGSNYICMAWLPSGTDFEPSKRAKEAT